MNKYLMFADTDQGEFQKIIVAKDDSDAAQKMEQHVKSLGVVEVFTIAGVWEHDKRFHFANKLSDVIEPW